LAERHRGKYDAEPKSRFENEAHKHLACLVAEKATHSPATLSRPLEDDVLKLALIRANEFTLHQLKKYAFSLRKINHSATQLSGNREPVAAIGNVAISS